MARLVVSEDLQHALEVDPSDPEGERIDLILEDYSILHALNFYHLGLRGTHTYNEREAERVLRDILVALDGLFRTGSPKKPAEWARTTLKASLDNKTQPELSSVIRGLGFEDGRIEGEPRFRDLAKALRRLVMRELEPALERLVTLWKSQRLFEEAIERRKRRPRIDPGVRRDRALTPKFTPPGRT